MQGDCAAAERRQPAGLAIQTSVAPAPIAERSRSIESSGKFSPAPPTARARARSDASNDESICSAS